MSTVGIVTLDGYTNYGNRLQNFALQETLSGLGVTTVETLHGLPRGESGTVKAERLARTALSRPQELVARVRARRSDTRTDHYSCPPERQEAIRAFSDEFLRSAPLAFQDMGRADIDRYSHFVVGSDQVWNPAYTHVNPEWFASFAPRGRRIAYAASFGIPKLPGYLIRRYRRGLLGIDVLSVREHQAAKIVKDLTGRTVPVVLDPTILLRRPHWDSLAQTPPALEQGAYIAQFMLSSGDGHGASNVDLSGVRAYSRRSGVPLVDLHDPVADELRALGPLGFVSAIRGARLVVTDSFHAAVFSMLFHRPFLLVERGSMNSRFETLLAHSGLHNHGLSATGDVARALDIDWGRVDARLEATRIESIAFLARALGSQR